MNGILQNLLKLQAIEFGGSPTADDEAQKKTLRSKIPQPILGHYDRLRAREKKGVAVVRNQVCTGCQMRLPIGTINTLMQAADIQLCDTCGRYLYLPPVEQAAVPEPVVAAKPAPKPRKRRTPSKT